MNKKWSLILVFALFLGQCKNSANGGKSPDPVDKAADSENKVILSIFDVALTNRDLKKFFKLQYADIFEQKNNDKLLSRLFDVFCEQQVIWFKAKQEGIQVGEDEITSYLGEIQSRRQDMDVDRQMIRNVLTVQKFLLATAYKDIAVGDDEDAAAAPAVAAVGAAPRHVLLAPKGHAAVAAGAGLDPDPHRVDQHGNGLQRPWAHARRRPRRGARSAGPVISAGGSGADDADEAAEAAPVLESHGSVHEREQRVVLAPPHVRPRDDPGAALAQNNCSG